MISINELLQWIVILFLAAGVNHFRKAAKDSIDACAELLKELEKS